MRAEKIKRLEELSVEIEILWVKIIRDIELIYLKDKVYIVFVHHFGTRHQLQKGSIIRQIGIAIKMSPYLCKIQETQTFVLERLIKNLGSTNDKNSIDRSLHQ